MPTFKIKYRWPTASLGSDSNASVLYLGGAKFESGMGRWLHCFHDFTYSLQTNAKLVGESSSNRVTFRKKLL
jgi:hypothetical protein